MFFHPLQQARFDVRKMADAVPQQRGAEHGNVSARHQQLYHIFGAVHATGRRQVGSNAAKKNSDPGQRKPQRLRSAEQYVGLNLQLIQVDVGLIEAIEQNQTCLLYTSVGSGGVMLPNHAPLVVAEQFGTLEELYPGRIDLGLGRAPGGDAQTMRALRRDLGQRGDDFPELLDELRGYLGPEKPGRVVRAIPGQGSNVPITLLGSSGFSAQLAGMLGLPFAVSYTHLWSRINRRKRCCGVVNNLLAAASVSAAITCTATIRYGLRRASLGRNCLRSSMSNAATYHLSLIHI